MFAFRARRFTRRKISHNVAIGEGAGRRAAL
jgi:hypothetical protein